MNGSRVVLPKSIQQELILSAKLNQNMTWKELAVSIDLTENYLKNDIKNGYRTLSFSTFKKLCLLVGKDYSEYISGLLDPNWGRALGGKMATRHPKIPSFLIRNKSEKLAEIIGILLGDGSSYALKNKSIYQISVACDKLTEKEYLRFIKLLFNEVFEVDMQIKIHRTKNVIYLYKQSKDLAYTLERLGFLMGNKKINNVGVPKWVSENKQYLKACIRGLIDTDGSIYPKSKEHKFPAIWFRSSIPKLRKDFRTALLVLGYNPSQWDKRACSQCCIYRKTDVFKFAKEIGFNNPKHQKRFKNYCSDRLVRSNST